MKLNTGNYTQRWPQDQWNSMWGSRVGCPYDIRQLQQLQLWWARHFWCCLQIVGGDIILLPVTSGSESHSMSNSPGECKQGPTLLPSHAARYWQQQWEICLLPQCGTPQREGPMSWHRPCCLVAGPNNAYFADNDSLLDICCEPLKNLGSFIQKYYLILYIRAILILNWSTDLGIQSTSLPCE